MDLLDCPLFTTPVLSALHIVLMTDSKKGSCMVSLWNHVKDPKEQFAHILDHKMSSFSFKGKFLAVYWCHAYSYGNFHIFALKMGVCNHFCSHLHVVKLYLHSEFNLWSAPLLAITVQTTNLKQQPSVFNFPWCVYH